MLNDLGRNQNDARQKELERQEIAARNAKAREIFREPPTPAEIKEALDVPHGTPWVRAVIHLVSQYKERYAGAAMDNPTSPKLQEIVSRMAAADDIENGLLVAIEEAGQHN